MADATKLPLATELRFFYWQNTPSLDVGLSQNASDNNVKWSSAPTDKDGNVITGGFLLVATAKNGKSEMIWVPPGAVTLPAGRGATGCIRGIKPNGLDYTTGDPNFILELDGGSEIVCVIAPQDGELLRSAIQGGVATGGDSIIIGTDALGTITIYRSSGTGAKLGVYRWNSGNGKAEFANDGVSWNSFDNVIGSNLVVVTNSDTTPGNLNNKTSSGSNIVRTVLNPGGNEQLQFSTSLPLQVSSHIIYSSAVLTGGNLAQNNPTSWAAISGGSFKITLDSVAYNVTGINFTGVSTMAGVATIIQTALRAASGTLVTVAWVTDHFVITSGNTTSASAITTTVTITSGTVGVDISGQGAQAWMDTNSTRGTTVNAVLNPGADAGKVALLGTGGVFDTQFMIDWAGTGVDGALNVASGTTTLNLDQVYNFTDINIAAGATLAFTGTTGTAYIHCSGNFRGAGTIELRNAASGVTVAQMTRFGILNGSAVVPVVAAPNVGGAGGAAGVLTPSGGTGGTSTVAGAGTGGTGGTALGGVGGNGAGGGSTTGGGGGGGGGGGTAQTGANGSNASGVNGGAGGAGSTAVGFARVGGAGGGGGGGLLNGNGGAGGDSGLPGSAVGAQSGGGTGGASGATGGNGGNGGVATINSFASSGLGSGNNAAGAVGGTGGWGFALGGTGGKGQSITPSTATTVTISAGAGGPGGNSSFGTGGAGGDAGDFVFSSNTGTFTPATGGRGGDGRVGGAGGRGTNCSGTGVNQTGGTGGRGGDAKNGCAAMLLTVQGQITFNGTINANGGNGGNGGAGGTAVGTAANTTGGAGGNASRGSDVVVLSIGSYAGGITLNNSNGTAGTGGAAGTGGSGAAGAVGAAGTAPTTTPIGIIQKLLI